MAQEIEVKILEVDPDKIAAKLAELGAKQLQDAKLTVDWFRPHGIKGDDDPWYLRVRRSSEGSAEITWKSIPVSVGISKQVREINLKITDPDAAAEMFAAIDFDHYAHQEKFRKSWELHGLQFDLDQYPGIPAYLEIEGPDEASLHKGIKLLDLEQYRTVSEGERTLLQKEYGANWHDMRF